MDIDMNFRAKDKNGQVLPQSYHGECWAWVADGQEITVERGTGYFDRHKKEVFEGDDVYVHYIDKSLAKVKFGDYPNCKLTAELSKPHKGFYLEAQNGDMVYIGLLNKNSEIVNMNNYIMIKDDCGLTEEQVTQRRAEENNVTEK